MLGLNNDRLHTHPRLEAAQKNFDCPADYFYNLDGRIAGNQGQVKIQMTKSQIRLISPTYL
jgi:hypothetical protein